MNRENSFVQRENHFMCRENGLYSREKLFMCRENGLYSREKLFYMETGSQSGHSGKKWADGI